MGSARRSPKVVALVRRAMSSGSVGEYQLQAAIAALHDEAPRAEDTDWPQILALYGVLQRMSDNPVVALNHAIATAMVDGPRAGLALLEALDKDERLAGQSSARSRCARTCSSVPASRRPRFRCIAPQPGKRRACRSATIC